MPKKHSFHCKQCNKPIPSHNYFCHSELCDNCYHNEYCTKGVTIFEINPAKLPTLCKINDQENMQFRYFLKEKELDKLKFKEIIDKVTRKIDCTKCAACCKRLTPILYNEDIERISRYLKISEKEFIQKYLRKNTDNEYGFKDSPCRFLKDNRCQIYDVRPRLCGEYPFLDKDIANNCNTFFTNAKICPISFNVLENSKDTFLKEFFDFESEKIMDKKIR